MCRLFAFRSPVPSGVHRSLIRESNALRIQSREHPDGWGIGWWPAAAAEPSLERGAGAAFAENDFERVASMVSAASVIAHVRKASVGRVGLANTHPFRHGRWLFAHNGTIARFADVRSRIEAEIDPRFRDLTGETDSERCFGVFLTHLAARGGLDTTDVADVARALRETVATVTAIADDGAPEPSSTTFLAGDGRLLAAYRRGRTLYWSAHKTRCSERGTCNRFATVCESPAPPGTPVSHFLIASERLSTEDVWAEVGEDEVVGIDASMRIFRAGRDT